MRNALIGDLDTAISQTVKASLGKLDEVGAARDLATAVAEQGHAAVAADVALRGLVTAPDQELLGLAVEYLVAAGRVSEIGALAVGKAGIAEFAADMQQPISIAIETLEAIVRTGNDRVAVWATLGNLLSRAGHHAKAVVALRNACGGGTGDVTNLLTLGQVLLSVGDFPAAANAFHGALALQPDSAAAQDGLSNVASHLDAEITKKENTRQAGETDGPLDAYRRRDRLILTAKLLPHLAQARLVVVDGGAREAHRDVRWLPLTPGHLEIHGFEPDAPECGRLNAELARMEIAGGYYPIGLWSETTRLPFEINLASGGHSFIPQNVALTDRWKFENPTQISLSKEVFRPIETVDMEVTRLDTWAHEQNVTNMDFCKLNVQGAEIEILEGSGAMLDSTLGLLLEVAFVESYIDRPMFSDVDAYVRAKGFVFFDLLAHHYVGRADSDVACQHFSDLEPRIGAQISSWGQLIEGHALYLRDPIEAARSGEVLKLSEAQLLKLVIIAEIFGQIEYAFELAAWIRQRAAPGLAEILGKVSSEAAEVYVEAFSPERT